VIPVAVMVGAALCLAASLALAVRPLRAVCLALGVLIVAPVSGCSASTVPPRTSGDREATADQVLAGLVTTIDARDTIANAAAMFRLRLGFLQADETCITATVIRAGAVAGIDSLEIKRTTGRQVMAAGTVDLSPCGPLPTAPLDPHAALVLSGALDTAQGGLGLSPAFERDPSGYGIGCAAMEAAGTVGLQLLAELGTGQPLTLSWPEQPLDDPAACRAVVLDRAVRTVQGLRR
jgi:hypothetical protein